MDKNLNELLKWSIENTKPSDSTAATSTSTTDTTSQAPSNDRAPRPLDPALLASLFGGPSDAELMRGAMAVITSPPAETTISDKLIAFDNLEQLIESLDNANNLGPLSLWQPLLEQLHHEDPRMRAMAAWCTGTAVQNNEPTQRALLAQEGGLRRLVAMATGEGEEGKREEDVEVRRKAMYALSSAVRNHQPAMDVACEELGKLGRKSDKVDAGDMAAVDTILGPIKEEIKKAGEAKKAEEKK